MCEVVYKCHMTSQHHRSTQPKNRFHCQKTSGTRNVDDGFKNWIVCVRMVGWMPKFILVRQADARRHLQLTFWTVSRTFLIYSSSAILYRRRKLAVTLPLPKKVCLMPTVNLSCGLQLPLPWSRKLACCNVADLLNSAHIVADVYVLGLQGIILVGRWQTFNRKG